MNKNRLYSLNFSHLLLLSFLISTVKTLSLQQSNKDPKFAKETIPDYNTTFSDDEWDYNYLLIDAKITAFNDGFAGEELA